MCLSRAFIKRIVPFVLTFAVGLLIASFFVSITPNFKFRKGRFNQRRYFRELRYENERLQIENQRLKQRLDETQNMILLEAPVPPPPPTAPVIIELPKDAVPAAPRAR